MSFAPLPPGTILSRRYKIVSLIRKGGMGAAYRAEDLEIGRAVAVKELVDAFDSEEDRLTGVGNFLAEMRVLKSLRHPQIPTIYDHFVDKRGFFFVQEFVEGRDFTAKLESTNRQGLSEEEVIQIGIHVCRVLDYLHGQREPIVHRDIKSSNLMERQQDGRIMVVDFGIARAAKPREGMMIGTLGYSPPEQHLNQTDPRSDIYALGATLHELATGKRPDADRFEFAWPADLRPDLSPEFCDVLRVALYTNPDERFQDARLLMEALQNLLPYPVPPVEADPLEEACRQYAESRLLPLLSEIRKQHLNECLSGEPREFQDPLEFTLGTQVPCSLIAQLNREKESLDFFVKEGILRKVFIGEIPVMDPEGWSGTQALLERFLTIYHDSAGHML